MLSLLKVEKTPISGKATKYQLIAAHPQAEKFVVEVNGLQTAALTVKNHQGGPSGTHVRAKSSIHVKKDAQKDV